MSSCEKFELHAIGFGPSLRDFEILQQLAQWGNGGFQLASLDFGRLRQAFTSVSQSITTTRIRSSGYVISPERRRERTVRFGQPFDWGSGHRPGKGVVMECIRSEYAWDPQAQSLTTGASTRTYIVRRQKPHAQ